MTASQNLVFKFYQQHEEELQEEGISLSDLMRATNLVRFEKSPCMLQHTVAGACEARCLHRHIESNVSDMQPWTV